MVELLTCQLTLWQFEVLFTLTCFQFANFVEFEMEAVDMFCTANEYNIRCSAMLLLNEE
jgi:hypothetical protein